MNKQILFKTDPIEYGGTLSAWVDYRNDYPNFGDRKLYSGRSHPAHYERTSWVTGNKYTVVIYETKKYIMIEVQV